jgi:hypothetical protein
MNVSPNQGYQAYRMRAVQETDDVWRAVWSLGMLACGAAANKRLVCFPSDPRSFTAGWPDPTIDPPPDPPSPWSPRWKPAPKRPPEIA